MGIDRPSAAPFEQNSSAFLGDADKTNKALKLFWLAVGEKDTLKGGHTWINWRHYLHDYAQLLFR